MKALTFLLLLISIKSFAQFGPQQIITLDANGAISCHAADIDGDGNTDVVSASQIDGKIAWHRNTGLSGVFEPQSIIGNLIELRNVYVSDLDTDGDMDVLASSPFIDLVVWYENIDGLGDFGPQQIISNSADGAFSIVATDIDDDGDLDVVSASYLDTKLAWYENIDGQEDFGGEQIISTTANNGRSVVATDIDGDGDLDIMASSSGSSTISWFENLDGLGTYGPAQTIAGSALATISLFAIDIDGDSDIDVVAATPADNKLSWFENLNGLGNFGSEQVITTIAESAQTVFAKDLDNDGDADVLSASANDNKIAWYENLDGIGNFGPQQIITSDALSARCVYSADIDNDGFADVISASLVDNKIAWYKNLTYLDVPENTKPMEIKVYPNPAQNILFVEAEKEVLNKIVIFDFLGKEILNFDNNIEGLNLSALQSGVYILKAFGLEGTYSVKFIKN